MIRRTRATKTMALAVFTALVAGGFAGMLQFIPGEAAAASVETGTLVRAIYGGGAAWNGEGSIYYFGGTQTGIDYYGEIERYDIESQESEIVSYSFPALKDVSAVWIGDTGYTFGGRGNGFFSDEIWKYNEGGNPVLTEYLPTGLSESCAVGADSRAYIFGGLSSGGVQGAIYEFDPEYSTVNYVATLPYPRAGACAVWTGAYAYIFGGYDAGYMPTASIFRFNPANNTCLPVKTDNALFNQDLVMPEPLAYASAAYVNGTVFVYGGEVGGTAQTSIMKYHPVSNMIGFEYDGLPSGRLCTAAVSVGEEAYILGGAVPGDPMTPMNSIVRHTPDNMYGLQQFYLINNHPDETDIYSAGLVRLGSDAFLVGGMIGPTFPTEYIYRFDDFSNKWAFQGYLSEAVGESACVAYDDKLFTIGGRVGVGTLTNNVQWYRPRTNSVSFLTTIATPTARAKAVVVGQTAYLLGGVTASGATSDIVSIDLVTGTVNYYPGCLPYPVYDYTLAYDGDRYAYLVGGTSGSGTYLDTAIKVDMVELSAWSVGTVLPYPMRAAAGGYDSKNDLITIIGGESSTAGYNLTSIWLIDPATLHGDISSVSLPIPLTHAASMPDASLVFGGRIRGTASQNLYRYSHGISGFDGYALKTESVPPARLASAATAVHNKDMYIFGGTSNGVSSSLIYGMDDDTGVISCLSSTLPYPVTDACAATLGDRIYIFGGYSLFFTYPLTYTNAIYVYDPVEQTIANTGFTLPAGTMRASAVANGNEIYIIGGATTSGRSTNIFVFNPSYGVTATHSLSLAVEKPIAGYYDGYLYAAGGYGNTGVVSYVQRISTTNWTAKVVGRLPIGVYDATGGMMEQYIVLAGGRCNTTYLDRMLIYDTQTNFGRFSDFRVPITGAGIIGCAGSQWLFGGLPNNALNIDVVKIRFEPEDPSYDNCTTNPTGLDNPISMASVAFDGNAAYLLGGEYSGTTSASITRYWDGNGTCQLLAEGCGYAFSEGTATYIPSLNRIYFFGGLNGATYYDYIHYLDLNTISLVSLSPGYVLPNPLATMTSHLWYDDIMIVGGAIWDGSPTMSVYKFTPGAGAPVFHSDLDFAIAQHGSVLVDDQLYIFGGRSVTYPSNSIYRHDLVTGQSTLMDSHLPWGLLEASVVWDSDAERAIIMGGYDISSTPRKEIFIYDPATDILTMADSQLPTGVARGMGVYDSTLILGGITSTGSTRAVTSFRYVPNAPTGSDFVDDTSPGNITLDTNYPHAYSYDLKQTSTGLSVLNWQIEPQQEYYFEVEAGHAMGYEYVDSVEILGWFDAGSDLSSFNESQGGTGNFRFFYENSTTTANTAVCEMTWPLSGELTGFTFEEVTLGPLDPDRAERKILRFRFAPSYYMRWADGVSGGTLAPDLGNCWDDSMAYNDADSWNFVIDVRDSTGNANLTYDEFGVYKYQQMTVQSGDPYLSAAPGTPQTMMTTTDAGDYSYVLTRMNAPFRLSANITDLTGPETLAATYMSLSGGSLAGITPFTGAGIANSIYYKGLTGYVIHENATFGSWYSTALNWYIEVPAGLAEGQYDGYITYRSETATDPSQAADPANSPPVSPTSHSPASGATITGVSTTLSVSVSDPNGGEDGSGIASSGGTEASRTVLVTFMDANDDEVIGQSNTLAGGEATYTWYDLTDGTYLWYVILDDGEYATVSPTWSFSFDYNQQANVPSSPSPGDWATVTAPWVTLSCTISDPDGDEMWATIYDGNNNPLEGFGPVSSGSVISHQFTPPDGDNSWWVVCSDGTGNVVSPMWSYSFTFSNVAPNTPSSPTPADSSSVEGPSVQLSCYVFDGDGQELEVSFYGNDGGGYMFLWSVIAESGTFAWYTWTCPSYGSYSWYVEVMDGYAVTGGPAWTFTVTTMNSNPNAPSNESPSTGGSVGDTSVNLQCWVYDVNGDSLTVQFWEDGGGMIGQLTGVSSNSYPNIVWNTGSWGWHYWYVVIIDEHSAQTVGSVWSFQCVA